MTHPTLSVITVTFNAERTLPHTLKSVVEQTYPHIEYIVIDGASTDGTLQMLNQSGVTVHHLVSEPDKGLYDAMNKGAALATGDYLCFLNAGDAFFSPTTVEQIFGGLLDNEKLPHVIYGETALVNEARQPIGMRHHRAPKRLHWRSFRKGMLVSHQAFILRRDLFLPYDLAYRFSADVDWCIRVMKRSKRFLNTHLTLINYLNEGMTTANHKASLKERFRIMCKHYGVITTVWQHILLALRHFCSKSKA